MAIAAQTDYELGQDNVQFLGLNVHNPVFAVSRSLRRRRFAARNGSPAHDLSHVSGRLRRSAGRGGFSVVGEQMTKFGPRGPHGPPETAMRIDLSPL